jgi:hypothetical protein
MQDPCSWESPFLRHACPLLRRLQAKLMGDQRCDRFFGPLSEGILLPILDRYALKPFESPLESIAALMCRDLARQFLDPLARSCGRYGGKSKGIEGKGCPQTAAEARKAGLVRR